MTVTVRAFPGRNLTLTIAVQNLDGTPADLTGRTLLFQAREDTRRTLLLSGTLVPFGAHYRVTWTSGATSALRAGRSGVWEIVAYPNTDPGDVTPIASGLFEVSAPVALPS